MRAVLWIAAIGVAVYGFILFRRSRGAVPVAAAPARTASVNPGGGAPIAVPPTGNVIGNVGDTVAAPTIRPAPLPGGAIAPPHSTVPPPVIVTPPVTTQPVRDPVVRTGPSNPFRREV